MNSDLGQKYIVHLESILRSYEEGCDEYGRISESAARGILARSEAAIRKICVPTSPYIRQMESILEKSFLETNQAKLLTGVIDSLRRDLCDGHLESLEQLVNGEIFESFLDMAHHLLEEGYKDAAAVIAGSTLEAHLRRLCIVNGLDVTRVQKGKEVYLSASIMNQQLGNNVYPLYYQKTITAWLDIRNNAAHGHFGEYSAKQVGALIENLHEFLEEFPA